MKKLLFISLLFSVPAWGMEVEMEKTTEKMPINNDIVDRLYVRQSSSSKIARYYLLKRSLVTQEANELRINITQADMGLKQYEKLMGEKNPSRFLCLTFPRTLEFGVKQKETIPNEEIWYKLRLVELGCCRSRFHSFSSSEVIDLLMRARLYDTILNEEEWKQQLPKNQERKKKKIKIQEQQSRKNELATQRKEAEKKRELYYVAQLTKQDQ